MAGIVATVLSSAASLSTNRFGVADGIHCRKTPAGVDFKGEIRFHNGDDSTFKARRW